jgi:HlyD family secretion protein
MEQNSRSIPYYRSLDWVTRASLRLVRANAKRLIWAAAVVGLGLGTYLYVSSPAKVLVTVVRTIDTEETLGATGRVRGEKSVDLGLDASGVVRRVYVKDGDVVRAGTILLLLDKSDLDAGADASRAAVSNAEAELARASRPPLPSELRRARAELDQARSVGDAKVAGAQARLRDLQLGARSQEIGEAQAELQRLNALLGKAKADLKRTQNLVKQGAVAQCMLDDAQTSVETARATASAQEQRISILQSGSRPSQVAEAQAALAEARATRDTGVRSATEALNTILANPRPEDINAARAKLEQAHAELRRALDVRSKCELRAPFDGVVADLPVEQGQSISSGQKLVVFQEISKPIIEVETDEANLKTLRMGQKAVISSEAYPGQTFDAVLYDLGSKVDADRGTIKVKLRPQKIVTWLRPDLTVDVNIITSAKARRIVLPADTVTRHDGRSVVYAVRDGEAVPVVVTPGAVGPNGVAVTGDLSDGMLVARNAAGVEAGGGVVPVTR